ncbi:chemotaxis protein CheW [Telmatospirillum siberiense]|uniref:Chemotaxis protein CheA n=1 Tax=Telmatospirillum siberiense TaxID=382514 RepID=A0A2N3PPK7_9PROT|nr:chemotaxis protein CheW [Telmatospirillum siberiense]PKU22317.1 hybrid sensor histidine kinase/response regulator [Telmatospirillum siberiense]
MDDLLSEFLTETSESLSTLDVELVKLEQNPEPKILSNIFRLVHTIKGTCGFLGLPRLETVAHAGENVLGKFRDGELQVTPGAVTLILNCLDRIKMILGHIEATEAEPEGDDKDLIAQLNAAAEGRVQEASPAPAAEPAPAPVVEPEPAAPEPAVPPAAQAAPEHEPEHVEAPVPVAAPTPVAPSTALAAPTPTEVPKESAVAAQTIRVNVELLENLMTLVSELVLTRNQLLQMVRGNDDSEFATPLQRLSHITTDLQEGVMKTRMQPIGNAWAKLPRIVRDLSVEMNKKIDLQMIGAETELDRQVLELIKDPLTHMVRNSADHGLESTNERRLIGKPEVGKIVLNAYHEGGHIIIEIADDGRGLNIARIRQKVAANGLATEGELEQMNDQQVAQYIFRAGFSTAEKVTSVSGRGVGMDVVRTNIEKIGGTIELKTQQGKGTSFIIKIPLTLAIVSALIVECAGERFAIPQISVLELVRTTANSEHGIEVINNAPVLRLRDRLLPLVSLRTLLRLGGDAGERGETFIVVTQVGAYTFGIIVDRVFDTEEIVVKPVAPILRHISMFSGNTILGDGSVIMILDPNGIAGSTGEIVGGSQATAEASTSRDLHAEDRQSLLVFRAGGIDLKGVPLALVARLEEIEVGQIEHSHGKPVVQYRGKLMPLVTIDGSFDVRTEGRQPVLVFADRERSMGLVVDEIVDIVEERLKVELSVDQPGLIGTAVVSGKATDIIDAGFYLTQAWGDWFGSPDQEFQGDTEAKRILLVDDSPFFRNLLTPLLSVAGYEVTSVDSADKALSLRESGDNFDAIISDIEMPGMDGFDFAQAVRSEGRWAKIPMVALSSHATEKDFERGREVGFTDYVAKFDRDALLQTLAQSLSAKGAA